MWSSTRPSEAKIHYVIDYLFNKLDLYTEKLFLFYSVHMEGISCHLEEVCGSTDRLIEQIIDCAENLGECGEEERIHELKGALKTVVRTRQHVKDFQSVYRPISRQLCATASSGQPVDSLDELLERVERAATTRPNIRWNSCRELIEFKERLREVRTGTPADKSSVANESDCEDNLASDDDNTMADDDVIVETTLQPTVCPLTQSTFVAPVSNPDCGHTYSRDAIRQMAGGRASIPCPVMGCNRTVTISRLQANLEMERRINRASRVCIFI